MGETEGEARGEWEGKRKVGEMRIGLEDKERRWGGEWMRRGGGDEGEKRREGGGGGREGVSLAFSFKVSPKKEIFTPTGEEGGGGKGGGGGGLLKPRK